MAGATLKTNKKALIESARGDRPDKTNYTFRLPTALYEAFKRECEKNKVKPTAIIEAFLKDFIG